MNLIVAILLAGLAVTVVLDTLAYLCWTFFDKGRSNVLIGSGDTSKAILKRVRLKDNQWENKRVKKTWTFDRRAALDTNKGRLHIADHDTGANMAWPSLSQAYSDPEGFIEEQVIHPDGIVAREPAEPSPDTVTVENFLVCNPGLAYRAPRKRVFQTFIGDNQKEPFSLSGALVWLILGGTIILGVAAWAVQRA